MSKGVYNLLTDIANRCNVNSENILRKSKELITLLNSKQQLNCSDTCKVVICLELASSFSSIPLKREEAIKYSGCRKATYTKFYNNISKLLNLDKIYSISEICLLVGASQAKDPATILLQKYKTNSQETDFDHPMYACAAVLAHSRANKIKINLSKLVEISRIKKIELEKLCQQFSVYLKAKESNSENSKKKVNKLKSNDLIEKIELPVKKKATTGVMSNEEYEEWKRKMLED